VDHHGPGTACRHRPGRQLAVPATRVADERFPLHPQLQAGPIADMDASPTKAWLIENRDHPQWKWHYRYAFGKRPGEELYDLKNDPEQIKNVADDPAYAGKRKELGDRLMEILKSTGDPRVADGEIIFENPPFTTAEPKKKK
jgi:hypothetical protein